ncbi:MAG: tetratricopeptide repeat protein [Oscillatoriales cyanobacterium RM2_1_1]|nr:tetratricopeptide repeat protein [Oscillatoriales cyanobacterium SM2_3_0]NJO46821.1 tetratricopeptide repeat protein [Oscillatoriales cyanobacterium RM2_1_1]
MTQITIQELNQQAETQIAAENWTGAIALLEKIIELDPNGVHAYQKLGHLFLKTQQFEQAVQACQIAIRLDPSFFWSYNHLGSALSQLHRWEAAVETYHRALEIKSDFFWTYHHLGECLLKLQRWAAVDQVYTQASPLNADFFWMYENWGQALTQLKYWEKAEKIYRKAIDLQPDSGSSYYHLGNVLTRLQRWQDAVDCFQQVLKIQADFPQVQQNLENAQRVVQALEKQQEQSTADQLNPIDWLKYYPIWGESPTYMIHKAAPPQFDPRTQTWNFLVPPQHLRFVFDQSQASYLHSGKVQIATLLETLQQSGVPLKSGDRVLDFGCAAGRMIRELAKFARICEIWGVDISGDCIAWCKQNLTPPFHFLTGTTLPHLPFEDRYFDLIYAGSVFTHIDDLADAWFLELRRILKPGGVAYVTIQEQHLIEKIQRFYQDWLPQNNIWSKAHKVECIEKYAAYSQADFAMFSLGRETRSLVFYDLDYFCQQRQPFFKVLGIKKEAYYWQTAILLQRL